MRLFKAVSFLILGIALLTGQPVRAEGELQNKDLLEKSGVVDSVNGVPAALIEGLNEVRKASPQMDAKFLSAWKATVPLAYRADKIIRVIDEGMQKELTAEDKAELMKFFESDLGKRITTAEKAASNAAAEIQEYAKNPAAFADRVAIYKDLDREAGASEVGAMIIENTGVAMQIGIYTASNVQVDVAKLKQQAAQERATFLQQAEAEMLNTFAFTYRNVSVDDLNAYIAYLKTPIAKKFNKALGRLLNDALAAQSNDLGQMLIQNLTSGKPT